MHGFVKRGVLSLAFFILFHTGVCAIWAQEKVDAKLGQLTIDRIFKSGDFNDQSFGTIRWLKDGNFTTTEESKKYKGTLDIVKHDTATGKKQVLIAAAKLIPEGKTKPLVIQGYDWSTDKTKLLIFTNSKRVWRQNTRGDYWVYDIKNHGLHKLGGNAKPSTLMFAEFSPNGNQVAYVCEKNVFVEDLASQKIQQLTTRKNNTIINGTFDWVYEEELSLRDGIRWSPDSKKLAYWQLDESGVGEYYLLNNTTGNYQKLFKYRYPKVGTTNSAGRVGVVTIPEKLADDTSVRKPTKDEKSVPATVWMDIPGNPRDYYIARMDWAENPDELLVQQFNRLQNTNKLMLANATTGKANTIFVEQDKAWVEVHDNLTWLNDGKEFLWVSERDGWNHLYVVSRDGKTIKKLTTGDYDVIEVSLIDTKNGLIYFLASPKNATQQYLYSVSLADASVKRLTPEDQPGWHTYDISPNGQWAIHTYSTFDMPPVTDLIALPEYKVVRVLAANKKARDAISKLDRKPTDFFQVDIGKGVKLDAWCIKPPNFDASKKYPVLFYVYGEPAGQTVVDRWSGSRYLWHLFLAQNGYLVMSVDNRGTPAPRGRDFRKIIYRQIGILAPKDQAAAVKAICKQWPWVDADRIGVWGWSGGGSMSLHAIFRYPDIYKVAMSIAPVGNELFYDTIYQERYMGLPKDNADGYKNGSPLTYAKNLQGKLLLIHGTADDNVHYANAEVIVNALIAANKQFSMMAYPYRSHSINEGANTRRHLFSLLTNYLESNLPGGPRKRD